MYSSIVVLAACAGLSAAAATRNSKAYPLKIEGKCVVETEQSILAVDECVDALKFIAVDGQLKTPAGRCLAAVELESGKIVPGLVDCDECKEKEIDATWTEINGTWLYDSSCKLIAVKDSELVFTAEADNAADITFKGHVPSSMTEDHVPKHCSECPADSVRQDGKCVSVCQCAQNTQCGYGQVCNSNGWCQYDTHCSASKPCASGYFCDVATGRCVANDITCDWPLVFNGYYCVYPAPQCSYNTPCPNGQWCNHGQCVSVPQHPHHPSNNGTRTH